MASTVKNYEIGERVTLPNGMSFTVTSGTYVKVTTKDNGGQDVETDGSMTIHSMGQMLL